MKSKHPVHIMVFWVVTRDGDVIPPLIFPHRFKLNPRSLYEVFKCGSAVWILTVTSASPYVWQQDSALSRTWRKSQWLRSENLSDHINPNIWVSYSTECYPIDYCVLSVVERETKITPCHTQDKLKARIMTAFTNLEKEGHGKVLLEILKSSSKAMTISLNIFNL